MLNQKVVCEKFEAEFIPCLETEKLGLAIETIGQLPINGVTSHPIQGTSSRPNSGETAPKNKTLP